MLNYLPLKSLCFDVHDEFYSRHVRTKFDIYVFHYYDCIDTSAGGLIVPDHIIRSVVSVSVLTWFRRWHGFGADMVYYVSTFLLL